MDEPTDILRFIRIGGLPYGAVALLATLAAARLCSRTMAQLGDRFPNKRLTINQVGSFVRFGVYLLGGAITLALVLVLEQQVVIAMSGTAAVAIGFALKDLVASFVAGLIILVDKPFQVGDRVTFDGFYGEIRDIGLRSVRLVTLDDTLITIPNSKFLSDSVASGNAGEVDMMVQLDFFVGVDQEIASAKRIVTEALTTSRYVHLGRPWNVLVNQVVQENYFAVRLRAKAYVLDVQFEKAFETDVTERVLAAFLQDGVRPPAVLHRNI